MKESCSACFQVNTDETALQVTREEKGNVDVSVMSGRNDHKHH